MHSESVMLGDLRVEGRSWAGEETWFRVRPPGLAFDVGRGALQLAGSGDLFLSHGHLDHALGVPYVLSQRTLHHQAMTRIACPAPLAEPLARLIAAAEAMEDVRYDYQLVPLEAGDRLPVGPAGTVEAFAVEHGVPALGFHLFRHRRRLLPELAGTAAEDLVARRGRGEAIEETIEELVLTYCGDTGAGVFAREPRLFSSRMLLLECTFLGDGQEAKAREFGHLHIADLEAVADRFDNELIVLHHLSRRFQRHELEAALTRRLPGLAGRLRILLGAR